VFLQSYVHRFEWNNFFNRLMVISLYRAKNLFSPPKQAVFGGITYKMAEKLVSRQKYP
jgi:hypothetical protein